MARRRRRSKRIAIQRVSNPPRRRRSRRKNPAPARRRRVRRNPPRKRARVYRRNMPARRGRRRYRRNPGMMGNKWIGVALAAAAVTVAEGFIRAKATGMLRNWGPIILKAAGAWWFGRKEGTRPIAYALGALAVADLAAMVTAGLMPEAAAPTVPKSTAGWTTLPPGLAGPTGFPSGVGFPWAGIPMRIEQNPRAQGYAFGMADQSYVNPLGGVM